MALLHPAAAREWLAAFDANLDKISAVLRWLLVKYRPIQIARLYPNRCAKQGFDLVQTESIQRLKPVLVRGFKEGAVGFRWALLLGIGLWQALSVDRKK